MEHLLDNHITTQYPEIDHICEDFNNCIISAGRNSKLYFLFQVLLDTAVLNSSLDNTEYNLTLMHRLKETHALITEKGIFAPPVRSGFPPPSEAGFHTPVQPLTL